MATENRSNNCKNQTSNRTSNQTTNSATNEHKHPNLLSFNCVLLASLY